MNENGIEGRAKYGLGKDEHVPLAYGLLMDECIEYPKQTGRFDCRTGKAKGVPSASI